MLNAAISVVPAARKRQEELGQFFTPMPVADLMAAMFGPLPDVVRLLDAGAGQGALTAAFVSHVCKKSEGVRAIEVTLYEIDPFVQESLAETMQECQRLCAEAGIRFTFTIGAYDFILEMQYRLSMPTPQMESTPQDQRPRRIKKKYSKLGKCP